MIQEKRGMLKMWNVLLILGTFLLCIFATFLTRSGLIESVHSFAQNLHDRLDLPGLHVAC
jgi:cytochrome c-type biogenesis protein CcmF